jgi:hypothetical protein
MAPTKTRGLSRKVRVTTVADRTRAAQQQTLSQAAVSKAAAAAQARYRLEIAGVSLNILSTSTC